MEMERFAVLANLGTDSEFPANCAGNSCLSPMGEAAKQPV
jgi:hypothetical protein